MGTAALLAFPLSTASGSHRTEAATGRSQDEAFHGFYAATARPLWAYLRAASGNRAVADDLLQESYLRLLTADLRHEEDSGRRAYLYRIAGNLLKDHWRRERRRPTAAPLLDDEGAAEPVAGVDASTAGNAQLDVQRALARLAPRDRQLLWLAHVEGASHREVAAALGLAAASVRVLLFRARRRLAAQLGVGGEWR
ncbi:MAG TPA: RNA polymerase sigma factor [Thermoanaerobaculia bacterium]|nr:RNA polymerase sigma factor [Thermoanaerobaculia bacterium]